ncbi:MAG: sigma-70 family RNA polymerase sigma factor [Acidobacteria bacterium]|nr:sigma-70 family RNA polymerase sigma factor [Acidobacteriota bacterium]MBI3658452.1 sigma-70 family RNA polymerase sigma factor [Acidobacteriota bacterium]
MNLSTKGDPTASGPRGGPAGDRLKQLRFFLEMEHYADEELVASYNGSVTTEEAEPYLGELLGRYHKKVIRWCLHMTGRREDAADLAQEIFMKVMNHLERFRGESRFSTWLYQIARNHCRDFLKQRRHELFQPLEDSESFFNLPAPSGPSIEMRLDRQEALKVFMNSVNTSLTDLEKNVAYMHFADGMTLSDITQMLALTNKSGAKAYLVSAKRKLRKRMARWLQSHNIEVAKLF